MLENEIYCGDCRELLKQLDDGSIQCCVTSPPYWWLRGYGLQPTLWDDGAWLGTLGREPSPGLYVKHIVDIFREVRRVLRNDGTVWLNTGDKYARKQLCLIPQRLAIALQDDGWCVRSIIIWSKSNPKPEPVRDRPSTAHEYVLLLAKSRKYYYDADAIRQPLSSATLARNRYTRMVATGKSSAGRDGVFRTGSARPGVDFVNYEPRPNPAGRNTRTVWELSTESVPGSHFATFPKKLVEPMILAGTRPGDVVLDPFVGSGTVAVVAANVGRNYIGFDQSEDYVRMAQTRIKKEASNLVLVFAP